MTAGRARSWSQWLIVVVVVVVVVAGGISLWISLDTSSSDGGPRASQPSASTAALPNMRATPPPTRPLPSKARLRALAADLSSGSKGRMASALAGVRPADLSEAAVGRLRGLSDVRFATARIERRGPETALVPVTARARGGAHVKDAVLLVFEGGRWMVATGLWAGR